MIDRMRDLLKRTAIMRNPHQVAVPEMMIRPLR